MSITRPNTRLDAETFVLEHGRRRCAATRRALAWALALVSLLGLPADARAQQGPPPGRAAPPPGVLSLGSVEAVPDTQAVIPVLYFPEDNQPPLTALKFKVCLSSEEGIKFVTARPGMGGEAGKAEVKTATAAKEGGCTPIEVETAFKAAPKKGTLLELVFDIGKQAPVDQTVTLTATFSPSGGPGEKSISSKGDLKIMKVMPVFTCFLYMH